MPAHAHTRLLLLAVAAALLVVLAGAGIAGAQETTGSATEEVLSRYDSRATAEMAAEYEADRARADELDAEIEAATDAGDWELRGDLHDELSEMTDASDAANALGDARLADIEASQLPVGAQDKAVELRRKAQSLDALAAWGSTAPITIDSRLYGLLGKGEAAQLARTYRADAGALEVAHNSEEVAREEAEEAAPKPEPEPVEEGAAPGDGGEKPAEEEPVRQPEAAPVEAPTSSGTGLLAGVNLVPILAFVALVGAALFALSKSAGVSVGKFFSPAMAEVSRKKPKPKTKAAPKTSKTKAATGAKTRTSTPEPEAEEKRPEPELPEDRDEPGPSADELQRMFDRDAPEPEKPKPEDDDDDDEPPV